MRTQRTDSGSYNRPAVIQKLGPRVDDGMGGNVESWITVRGGGSSPLMVFIGSGSYGRGLHLVYKIMQLYPDANHYAMFRYASDAQITAGMRLSATVNRIQRYYRILGAEDVTLEHVTTILPLVEIPAQGSI